MLSEIPLSAPETPLLTAVDQGASVGDLDMKQLQHGDYYGSAASWGGFYGAFSI